MNDQMIPCPICGQAMWTYRTRALHDMDRPYTGPEYFVGHQVKGEPCPGSHQPVIQEAKP
jgi:hypothetical protein